VGAVIRGAVLQAVAGPRDWRPGGHLLCTLRQSQLYETTGVNPSVMAIAIAVLVLTAALRPSFPHGAQPPLTRTRLAHRMTGAGVPSERPRSLLRF